MSVVVPNFVSPPKKLNVPNHLVDTQVFPSHQTLSNVLAVDKQSISFKGFQLGRIYKQRLNLTNKANGVRRMHIIPPASPFFKIKYKKEGKLMPGFRISVTVEFRADVYNLYEDFIRIHCEDGKNIVIPLYGFPVLDLSDFPQQIIFPKTAICKQVYKIIKLATDIPVEFKFHVQYHGHPSITVSPSAGLVPGMGMTELRVVFCPTEYVTVCGTVELTVLSQHDTPVYTCAVTGVSQPGIERDLVIDKIQSLPSITDEVKEQFEIKTASAESTPRPRTKAKKRKEKTELVVNGVRFPENLNTHTAVANILNQKPGHLKASELRGGSAAATIAKQIGNERQLKCAVFESIVKQKALEERNNKLRWMSHLGSKPLSEARRQEIERERNQADVEYQQLQLQLTLEEEFSNSKIRCLPGRVYRWSSEHTTLLPSFDPYKSSEWGKRKLALGKFIQAVRKVIIQTRVAKRFKVIRHSSPVSKKQQKTQTIEFNEDELGEVTPTYQPLYHIPAHDFHINPSNLEPQDISRMNLYSDVKNPVFDLKVPVFCKLLSYKEHEVQYSEVHEAEPPEIRVGARDELTVIIESDPLLSEDLQPSPHMSSSIEYPPLIIFNPTPNIQNKCPTATYLETNVHFRLDPLLKLPLEKKGPLIALHPHDVIPGTQQWYKYPSQLLVSTGNAKSIGNQWNVRRDTAVSTDMIGDIPCPLKEPCKDIEVLDDEDNVYVNWPTPQFVASQFKLSEMSANPEAQAVNSYADWYGIRPPYYTHGANGPVTRSEAQTKQDDEIESEQSNLSAVIHRKLLALQKVINNPELRLEINTDYNLDETLEEEIDDEDEETLQ